MNTAILVASFEVRQRARLFVVAAAVALIPFISAVLPAVRNSRATAIGMTGLVLSIAFSAAIALGLGATTIGRELTEKRLSFYFARPISPASIWIGKAVASMLIVYATAVIIALPAYLASQRMAWFGRGPALAVALIMPLVLFLGSHAISTIVRSRSIVMAIDLASSVAAGFAIVMLLRPIVLGGALEVAKWMVLAFAIAVVAILAIAPIGQLAHGRTDIRRSHAALARFLWPAVGGVLLLMALFVWWLTSTPLSSLDEMQTVSQSANGEWVLVEGADAGRFGYTSSFLVNTVTGENERLNAPTWWGTTISRDGRVLTWLEPLDLFPSRGGFLLNVRRLDRDAKAVATTIQIPTGAAHVISDDGSRIAISHSGQVSVIDIASGKILAASNAFRPQLMFFVNRDLVRAIESAGPRTSPRVGELDVVQRRFTTTGRIDVSGHFGAASGSADGSLLYLPSGDVVVDGRTGARIATLDLKAGARMLNDGTLVEVAQHTLRRLDAHGRELARVAMPFERAAVLGQIGQSKVVVGGGKVGATIVDLDRGVIESRLADTQAVWTWTHDPRVRQYLPGATINGVQKRDGRVQLVKMKTAS